MTTLATMRGRVKTALGNKQGFNDEIDQNLNEATLQHVMAVKPKEMQKNSTFSITSATAAYDLEDTVATDGDLYSVLYVRNVTDDEPMTQGNEHEYHLQKQVSSDTSNLGKPHKWVHIEDDLVLYEQIPDSTARTIGVRYLRRPAVMTSAVDFPLNREHERPVEQLAKALTWLDLGNEAKAQAALESYQSLVQMRFSPEEVEDEHAIFQVYPSDNLYEAD